MPPREKPNAQARIASALLLALTLLWCLYWFVHSWHYWEDDAFIHLEFARSLAAGRGFAFNGRVVAGDTAPLWVFLLAATHTLIPDWLVAGKLLTLLGAALGLTGAYAFARTPRQPPPPPGPDAALFPAALLLLIAANPYFCYWVFSGMEPLAASGLAFFAVLAATRAQPSTKTLLAACLLAGLAPLLRPEMAFLTALLLLPLLAQWRRLPGNPTSPSKLVSLRRRSAPARRSTLALGPLLAPRLRTSPAQHQRRQARRPSSLRPPPSPLRLLARLPPHPLRPPRRHPLSPPASRRRPPLPAKRRRLCLRASLRPHSRRVARPPPAFPSPAGSSSSGPRSRPSSTSPTTPTSRPVTSWSPLPASPSSSWFSPSSPRRAPPASSTSPPSPHPSPSACSPSAPWSATKQSTVRPVKTSPSSSTTTSRPARPSWTTPSERSPSSPSIPSSTPAESPVPTSSPTSAPHPRPCCSGRAPRVRSTGSAIAPPPTPSSSTPSTRGSPLGPSTPRSTPPPAASNSGSSPPPQNLPR